MQVLAAPYCRINRNSVGAQHAVPKSATADFRPANIELGYRPIGHSMLCPYEARQKPQDNCVVQQRALTCWFHVLIVLTWLCAHHANAQEQLPANMVLVPAGEFLMGADNAEAPQPNQPRLTFRCATFAQSHNGRVLHRQNRSHQRAIRRILSRDRHWRRPRIGPMARFPKARKMLP